MEAHAGQHLEREETAGEEPLGTGYAQHVESHVRSGC